MRTPQGHSIFDDDYWDDEDLPLYHRYPRQHRAQDAYLEISADGAGWNWNAVIGSGVPPEVWHGLRRRVQCDPCLSGADIRALCTELGPHIDQVIEGLDREWNGNNFVGTLTEEAETALDVITATLAPPSGDHRYHDRYAG